MSQIFWNLVYSLSGVKVRECPSLFLIFANFGPGGPKNGHFWPFFGHFCSFLDLKTFLESGFFLFFNMMFLGIFRTMGLSLRAFTESFHWKSCLTGILCIYYVYSMVAHGGGTALRLMFQGYRQLCPFLTKHCDWQAVLKSVQCWS